MDLARSILFAVEEMPYDGQPHEIAIAGSTAVEINYHVLLLSEPKLVETAKHPGGYLVPIRLTWDGHEYLAGVQDDGTWARVKGARAEDDGACRLKRSRSRFRLFCGN
jgi:hypothetical protein